MHDGNGLINQLIRVPGGTDAGGEMTNAAAIPGEDTPRGFIFIRKHFSESFWLGETDQWRRWSTTPRPEGQEEMFCPQRFRRRAKLLRKQPERQKAFSQSVYVCWKRYFCNVWES